MSLNTEDIVTDLINALPGNSSVNAVRIEQKHGDIGSPLPCNAAVNMHPQQWETVFSVRSVLRRY
jgi:hypothetical protein